MKYPVYSIRDTRANNFGFPQVDINDDTAERNFGYAMNGEGVMNFRPQDYDLYKIGEFDTLTGVFEPIGIPEFVVSGTTVLEKR